MVYQHTATFDAPIDEVFAWHARPGAIRRLVPPWQPVKVAKEAGSLRDGTAVLTMVGGLPWRAEHQPSGYVEGRQFTDVLTTPVLAQLASWRHVHRFAEAPGERTVITDEVHTRVPDGFIAEMFAYRTRQLSGDLAAHRRFPSPLGDRLTVAVTGSSGLVGSALTALLSTGGHRVIRLVRSHPSQQDRLWRPEDPAPDLLDGVDAVVHLAGASIAGRFSAGHKKAVRDSRVSPTRLLAEVAARRGVKAFVSASAIGIYGYDRGDEELVETSERGEGFLADVVEEWESSADIASDGGARVVKVRTGIVQSPDGGALGLLRPLFAAGLGGRLGNGRQWTAWVGLDDMVDIYLRGIVDTSLSGPVNAVAPQPLRNADYTRTLAKVLHRPAVIPVPAFGPQLLLGAEGAREVAGANQRVLPEKLSAVGHPFRYPDLEACLRHCLGRSGKD